MEHRENDPQLWLDQIFSAKAVASSGVIRRNAAWVANEIGRERFMAEVRARGFHLLETRSQMIVICHSGPVHMHF